MIFERLKREMFFINFLTKQVAPQFRKHISNGYLSNSGELTKHSALYLRRLTTELSGRYSCKVSSVHEEDFKSKDFIIYGNLNSLQMIRKIH